MLAILFLCLVIYISAYVCLKASGQSLDVRKFQTFEDYFIGSNGKVR
ncbi:hypothetical protein J2S19_004658 [Metabacillus malikii]|uniref:Uncharacterized protein n=1 Tax=Metabacillus malikii TaxID=1504265 RepID=A0ABT9ZP66_9BACI|nr:hypothetical protein [Metabacillus malikii]